MPEFLTETRVYVGQVNTIAQDGFAEFRIGQAYYLRYLPLVDGLLLLDLLHHSQQGLTLELNRTAFERWFVRQEAGGE